MRHPRRLKLYVERAGLLLSSLGRLRWTPLVVLNGVVPMFSLLFWISIQKSGQSDNLPFLRMNIARMALYIIPFTAVWWVIFTLRDRLEGDGHELLDTLQIRSPLAESAGLMTLFLLNALVLYSVLDAVLYNMIGEYLRVVIASILFFGLVHFIGRLSGSLTAALLVVLLVSMINHILNPSQLKLPFYYSENFIENPAQLFTILPLALLGVILAVASQLLPKRY